MGEEIERLAEALNEARDRVATLEAQLRTAELDIATLVEERRGLTEELRELADETLRGRT